MNWSEILSKVQSIADRFKADGSIAWFRGHRCAEWELKSAAHRHIQHLLGSVAERPPDADLVSLLREETKKLYRRFKADAWSLLHERERSEWPILFTMQHFGIPTRLLDWTESFACAVFFAQRRRIRSEPAAIWVLDPHAVNLASIGREGILSLDDNSGEKASIDPRAWHPRWGCDTLLPTIAVAPISSNPRMVSQRSVFTLTGDTFSSIDAQFEGLVTAGRIVKLVLEADTFDDAEQYLRTAGLNAFSFYPDLEGLAMKHEEMVRETIRDAKRFYPQMFRDHEGA